MKKTFGASGKPDLSARNFYCCCHLPFRTGYSGPSKKDVLAILEERFENSTDGQSHLVGQDGKGDPPAKRFLHEVATDGRVPQTMWFYTVGHTRKRKNFSNWSISIAPTTYFTPKPTRLIQRILQISTDPDSLILDSFAGSGTTGHAVLKQNAEDGGKRRSSWKWMGTSRTVTAAPGQRVVAGYNPRDETIDRRAAASSSVTCPPEPLFAADGQVREDVTFAQLAEFVWFVETGTGFANKADSPLLGVHEGRARVSALQRHPQGPIHRRRQRCFRAGVRYLAAICRPRSSTPPPIAWAPAAHARASPSKRLLRAGGVKMLPF